MKKCTRCELNPQVPADDLCQSCINNDPAEADMLIKQIEKLAWDVGHDPNHQRERGVKHNQVVLLSRMDVIKTIRKFYENKI